MSDISAKHESFITEYFKDFNQTRAYMRAYPDASEESAASSSSELLRNPKVKKEISKRIAALKERFPEDIIKHLSNLIFFNISDLLDDNGDIDKKKIKENAIPGIVTGISTQTDTIKTGEESEVTKEKISFKLTDQTKAIEIMSKILKLYEENKTEVNNVVGFRFIMPKQTDNE